MSKRIFKIGCLVVVGISVLLSITYVICNESIFLKGCSAVSDLGDIREAFYIFRETHGRWPNSMEEVYDMKLIDGIVTKDDKDPFSGEPYCCVTDKNLYYQIGAETPYRVLAMLPKPYRTKIWPFGEMKTIIASYSGVHSISFPPALIEGHVPANSVKMDFEKVEKKQD
jgi:hypothetical protein